jgi:hypothetical protein
MISSKIASIGLAASLVAILPAVSAQAQSPRTFVSAAGSDSNPCSFAAPCRHFQAAVNATSAGGEVDALDPAGYGPIVINQAVTIEGQGWSYIAPPAGGNGITINAGSGNVAIHGVSLNGAGITGGTNGIVFNSGSSLTVTDCVVQNFVGSGPSNGNGILIAPMSGTIDFTITNTTASNNGNSGIAYAPPASTVTANGVIDHVVANANQFGFAIVNQFSTAGSTVVTVSNSIFKGNIFTGLDFNTISTPLKVSVDNVSASSNNVGINTSNNANLLLGRSVITGNTTGVNNNATIYTYHDNRIDLNTTDVAGNALNTTKPPR